MFISTAHAAILNTSDFPQGIEGSGGPFGWYVAAVLIIAILYSILR